MNGNERNKAKRYFVLKKDLFFCLNTTHNPFSTNFEQKLQILMAIDNIPQNVLRVYRHIQYTTVVDRMPQ
jgi:hypothetical protein